MALIEEKYHDLTLEKFKLWWPKQKYLFRTHKNRRCKKLSWNFPHFGHFSGVFLLFLAYQQKYGKNKRHGCLRN